MTMNMVYFKYKGWHQVPDPGIDELKLYFIFFFIKSIPLAAVKLTTKKYSIQSIISEL